MAWNFKNKQKLGKISYYEETNELCLKKYIIIRRIRGGGVGVVIPHDTSTGG